MTKMFAYDRDGGDGTGRKEGALRISGGFLTWASPTHCFLPLPLCVQSTVEMPNPHAAVEHMF